MLAVAYSFFSAGLYRDVARRWRGIGFLYLAMVMLLASIPNAIRVQVSFAEFMKHEAPPLIEGFPTLSIHDGEVSIAEPQPYVWHDPTALDPDSRAAEVHRVILYVDTRGVFDGLEAREAPIRLSRTTLEFRTLSPPWTFPVSQIQGILAEFGVDSTIIDKAKLNAWLQWWAKRIGWIALGLFMVCGIIGHLLQIAVYALIGRAICPRMGITLSFAALMRLGAVALTPALLLETVLFLSGISIPSPYGGVLAFAIATGIFAIAVKDSDKRDFT